MKYRSPEELQHIKSSWEMSEDGFLIWARDANGGKKKGDKVGLSVLKSGHENCVITFNKKSIGYSVGQVAWFLYYGEWPQLEVDHINTNPKDNRKENLRLATRSQQLINRIAGKKGRKNKGVYKREYGNKWAARIWVNGKPKNIGLFNSKIEAVEARIKAAKMIQGEYANFMSY
jgi:hypothetical protein